MLVGTLADYAMRSSTSRKGNCYDNTPMECFFGTLKMELAHHAYYATCGRARQQILEHMEVFYNRVRRHARLNYFSLIEFEQQFYETKLAA